MLDDRGIVGKLLVSADEHAELVVVGTDVFVYHVVGHLTIIVHIIVDEVKHHVGVVHRHFAELLECKAIVVVPWLHDGYQFIDGMVELVLGGVVFEHGSYFFLRESRQLIELGAQSVVGADVESTGQVV